jgi:hypothetical protein
VGRGREFEMWAEEEPRGRGDNAGVDMADARAPARQEVKRGPSGVGNNVGDECINYGAGVALDAEVQAAGGA